jgi:L-methionine (R)-S-oxide reductase
MDVLVDEIAGLVAGSGSDAEVLTTVVERLAERLDGWNWVGIYVLIGDTLVLGPYVGKPTEHTRIAVGTGVCGTAVAEDHDMVVDDVRTLENYLACSLETRSELVVLIRDRGEVLGQFDIDSDRVAAFSGADEALLQRLGVLVGPRVRGWRETAISRGV